MLCPSWTIEIRRPVKRPPRSGRPPRGLPTRDCFKLGISSLCRSLDVLSVLQHLAMSDLETVTGQVSAANEPAWLNAEERRAWLALGEMMIKLPGALESQLQRDSGLSLYAYMVLSAAFERPVGLSRSVNSLRPPAAQSPACRTSPKAGTTGLPAPSARPGERPSDHGHPHRRRLG
jgi:hypothetical protein